mmetsp:Transcript_3847/g.7513  ORF Transcript_3847/g.7513 Transcript_3847/m.7513 type:complete len:567 (+) Transcript_3847:485-2185(+)
MHGMVTRQANADAVAPQASLRRKQEKAVVQDASTKLKQEILNSVAPPSSTASAQVQKLQDQADGYTRKIELERRHVSELDRQIAEMNQKIADQRKKVGGVNAGRENSRQIAVQTKTLENRLEKAVQKYNAAVARNRELRQQINDLRRERLIFDDIYKKLEKDLAEKKKEMAQVIEVSNKAYEARDAAVSEMARLKLQSEREQVAFQSEWRELGRLIDHDRKVRDFNKNRKADKQSTKDHVNAVLEQESKLRKKVISGNWGIAKDKVQQQVSMDKVQSYGEAFTAIQQATGITDIDELVNRFVTAEDENFRLYRYVDELNQEIVRMEEEIVATRKEIEVFRGGTVGLTSRKKVLAEIEDRLHETEVKAESYERKYQSAMKTVATLKEGVGSIFTKLGCNTPATMQTLGVDGISEVNIMQYLGMIEQRTNEILQMYAQSQALARGGAVHPGAAIAVLGQGPKAPPGSSQVSVEPPSSIIQEDQQGADSSDDDEEDLPADRPLSLAELQGKAMKSITKREMTSKKKKQGAPGRSTDNARHTSLFTPPAAIDMSPSQDRAMGPTESPGIN